MSIETLSDLKTALDTCTAEWLETTGTGGFAFSTLPFINTRRYHGLLVAGEGPDDSRAVLLSRCDEVLHCNNESLALGSRLFETGCAPAGFQFVTSTERNIYPATTYKIPVAGGVITLTKSLLALHFQDTVLIRYQFHEVPEPVSLELQPFLALRNYNTLMTARNEGIRTSFSDGLLSAQSMSSGLAVYLSVAGGVFDERNEWHRNIYYPEEKARGYDYLEDLFLPGVITVPVIAGQELYLVVSHTAEELRKPVASWSLEWDAEVKRRVELIQQSDTTEPIQKLLLAAEQFLVCCEGCRLDLIAGYPWFTCWARDTMIALPGLCLATGWFSAAREILLHWNSALSEGMLPNRLGVGAVKYNTVDGTLWYVVACYQYIEASGDRDFLTEDLYRSLVSIVDWHCNGTRYGIIMDPVDGLLTAGSEETQLTWMDAFFDGKAITPRWGKAVEINALWFNVLSILKAFAEMRQDSENLRRFQTLAASVVESFVATFWLPEQGYLADVMQSDTLITHIRPNQLFALSLPFPLLNAEEAVSVLDLVKEQLLTPVGLRTLAPQESGYCPQYKGTLEQRDNAYHQGTVWPWLFSPYTRAVLRFKGEAGRQEVTELFSWALTLLDTGALGTVSEVFDADPPRSDAGCVAQAWSVAALLEIAAGLGHLAQYHRPVSKF